MSGAAPVPISIGIATFRREEPLVCTLRQALALRPAPAEILVVDQTPEHLPETRARLAEWSGAGLIRWIRQEEPSLCLARNRVLLEARAEWVLFIDDDVLFESALAAHYWGAIHRNRSAAYVGEVHQVPRFEPWMTEDGAIARLPLDGMPGYGEPDGARVDFLRGCNFLVHRETAMRVRGFDENLLGSVYGDEMDFALRLIDAGEPIEFLRSPWLIHLGAPSGGCRIVGNVHFDEWKKTYCLWLLLFRHGTRNRSARNLFGGRILPFLGAILRAGPLRRENVVDPRRWFSAWSGVLRAALRGHRAARQPIRSPFGGKGTLT